MLKKKPLLEMSIFAVSAMYSPNNPRNLLIRFYILDPSRASEATKNRINHMGPGLF